MSDVIERFRKYRKGGIIKFQNPSGALEFRNKSQKYADSLDNTYDNVYATELNDSIQSDTSNYLANISKYKTAVKNEDSNYMNLDKLGIFNYKGNTSPYFKNFKSDVAKQIHQLGKQIGLTDNQIAVLIESGWRETNLDLNTHRKKKDGSTIAYGMWQFDGPSGTYNKYLNYLNGKPSTLSTQIDFLINYYMPTRGDFKSKYWDNPNVDLETLANQFLLQVETPKDRGPQKQARTKRAVKTIYGRK